jgi:tRNA threonylcarbamoyladenosine biosynthesis protein TsaB
VRVLAVDTTQPRASVAVAEDAGLLGERHATNEAGHSRWLLPAIESLLAELGLAPGALDLFAVTCGPGSFTGLRVGLGSVQGLALACRRPCLGIPTLDVLARGARAVSGEGPAIVALMDAFRGEVFWAVYDGEARLVGERGVGTVEAALAQAPPGSAFVGDAVAGSRAAIAFAVAGARFPETSGLLATTLAGMAIERASEAGPPASLRALYLRGASIRPPRP